MDFKWKWLILVVLTLHYSLEVSGLQCIICVAKKDDPKCASMPPVECATEADVMKIDGLVKAIIDENKITPCVGPACDTTTTTDNTNDGNGNNGSSTTPDTTTTELTTTPVARRRRSVGREKRAQEFVQGQTRACALYGEAVPKDATDLLLDIYSCTTLSPEAEAKVVDSVDKCDNTKKIDMKISGVDFSASECYCKVDNPDKPGFCPGAGGEVVTPPPSTTPPDTSDGPGVSIGSEARASVGLLLGAIGLFGFHQIQGVQPAL